MDKLEMQHTRMSAATHSEAALILPGQIRSALIESWGISRKGRVNGFTPIKILKNSK